ncbi:hypothetical protein GCK32_011953, partial [Trichostrongylus colubriformis]
MQRNLKNFSSTATKLSMLQIPELGDGGISEQSMQSDGGTQSEDQTRAKTANFKYNRWLFELASGCIFNDICTTSTSCNVQSQC